MTLAALDPALHCLNPAHFGSHRELVERIQDRSGQRVACVCCSEIGAAPESASFVEPGRLFVIQNAGGCVCAGGNQLAPSIEYALGVLKIGHLVVCGHLECRLIQSALATPVHRTLTPWERRCSCDLAPIVRRYEDRPAESLPNVLAQEQVLLQLKTLVDSPIAGDQLSRGALRLYGWLIDDSTARVFGFDVETGQFEPLRFTPTA